MAKMGSGATLNIIQPSDMYEYAVVNTLMELQINHQPDATVFQFIVVTFKYEYAKGLGSRSPNAPRPYKLALCAPCPIKGAPNHC
jgi:hypothetical protein